MADKKFCGNGKSFGKYGGINLGIKVSDLIVNEKGWANIVVSPKKDKPGEYYAYNDEYDQKNFKGNERAEQERQSFQPNEPLYEERKPKPPF